MGDQAYIGELAAGVFYAIAGLRLARLGSRTAEAPERLLAAMFFVSGLSYLIYTIPLASEREALWTPLNFIGRIVYLPAPVLLAAFTQRVFRPDSRWASWLVAATGASLLAGVVGSSRVGDWEGFSIANLWFWPEWAGYTVPFAWAGLEAFHEHRQARRRERLGLCDRLVCNRLMLWSLFGALQICISFAILPQYASYEQQASFSAMWDALIGALEILSVATVWLIFFPPTAYQRWVRAGANPAATPEVS